jgi:hypothetical protein
MTPDMLADLRAQSRDFWRNRGGQSEGHNVRAGSVKARRAADWRGRRRKWNGWLREVAATPPRG